MIQQPMMSPQGRPPQGKPRQGIAQINPNVPMQTQLNQFSKLPPQQLEGRKNESFLAAIAAEQQAAKAEAAQREKLMSENPELATDEKIIDRLRQSTIASMMPPTNPMPNVMDKAKGVAGVLQNKTANRKRSMNKIASAGLPATGKPPMKNMAGGGILGYKDGGKAEGSRLERALKALGITYKDYMALSPTAKKDLQPKLNQEYRKQDKEFTPKFGVLGPILQSVDEVKERTEALIASGLTPEEATSEERRKRLNPTDADISTTDLEASVIAEAERFKEETATARAEALPSQVAQEVESARVEALAPVKPSTVYDEDTDSFMPITGPAGAGAGAGAVNPDPNPQLSRQEQIDRAIGDIDTKDYTKGVGEKQVTDALGQPYIDTLAGMQEADPEAKRIAEEERLDNRFNPDDRIGALGRKQQERYEGILNTQQDPARMRELKRIAMGIGAAGQTDMGGIAAGIGAANLNFERQKDLSQLAGSRGLASLEDTDINRKTNVLERSTTGASTLGESIRADRRSGMTTGANIAEADLTAARTDVKNAFDRDVQIAGLDIRSYTNKLSADMNREIKASNTLQELNVVRKTLTDALSEMNNVIAEGKGQRAYNSNIEKITAEERAAIEKGEKATTEEGQVVKDYLDRKEVLRRDYGIDNIQKILKAKEAEILRKSSGGGGGVDYNNLPA